MKHYSLPEAPRPAALDEVSGWIQSGQAVLVVGPGVTIQATAGGRGSGWRSLLNHGLLWAVKLGVEDRGWMDSRSSMLEAGTVEALRDVAAEIEEKLKPELWTEWLRATIGQLTVCRPQVLDALGELALAAPLLSLTSDGLFEKRLGLMTVTQADSSEMIGSVFSNPGSSVLHLNGHWATPGSVSLVRPGYERLGSEQATALKEGIGAAGHVVLVGCGDGYNDPNFDHWVEWLQKVGGDRNPCFISCEDVEALRQRVGSTGAVARRDFVGSDDAQLSVFWGAEPRGRRSG